MLRDLGNTTAASVNKIRCGELVWKLLEVIDT